MPGTFEAITFITLAVQAGSVSGVVAGISAVLSVPIVQASISVGLSYLSSVLFAPKQPKPEDVQTSVRNPTAIRQRHYGRVKTSGPWVFAESNSGDLHKVIALGTGELDAIEEFWLDDKEVAIDEEGNAEEEPYVRSGDPKLIIQHRLGTEDQTHYADLTAVFPEWTSEHVGKGVSSLYIRQKAISQDAIRRVFPNMLYTNYRVVARASKVYNPVSETVAWSDNAADVIRDYMTHPDGARMPEALFTTPLAAAGWVAAHNRAALPVALKAGGTEPAYRLWGSYFLNERPADVLGRMLQNCDGRLVPTADGGLTLSIGTWAEPTVILDENAITGFTDLSRGRDALTTANVIAATFLSPLHDYQATDADKWLDDEDVAARGEIVSDMAFNMSPSHGQCRRLMKLAAYRANPDWVGNFQCNMHGMEAFGEPTIRIRYPLFEIDEVFEIDDFRFVIGDGGILQGVTLQVKSMPQAAHAWNATLEEGDAPVVEESEDNSEIPTPDPPELGVERVVVGSLQVPYGILEYDPPPSEALGVEARYRAVGALSWLAVAVDKAEPTARFGALSDGVDYEAQTRFVSGKRQGDWSDSATITPVADPTAPDEVTLDSALGGVGAATLQWSAPNSANYIGAAIRRNTVNTEAGAPVRLEYGPPSSLDTWADTGLAPGTYYYWIRAANASGIESDPVATGPLTVT